ncbi:immunity protein YezG family protein [Bacillus proteolyticus]|uniref:immunity protein YezG family protein n=1 Tax=Bacillus proteolyticus TaxID=2026192 RepID=UPI003D02AA96
MKEFEDKFSELQADMISICMEYVEDRADKVYVYASREEGIISGKFFYLINNKYVKPHKVNDALGDGDERYDVSRERQFMVLRIICEDIEKVEELCKEYERDMPTEMKLIYDVKSGKFKAEYKYDLVYTNDDVKTSGHIADEWFEEVKNNNL